MAKAILLVRVSTAKQDLVQQEDVLVNEAIRDGYKKENLIIIKDVESAVKLSEEERHGLTTLKNYILHDKSINIVYAYEVSRISRRPKVLFSIRDFFIENNIQLIILKPYIKLLENGVISQSSNLFFSMFSALAENEGYIRKERMARGRQRKREQGCFIGGKVTFGYNLENKKLVINEEQAKLVRYIFDMYVTGNYSMMSLAKELITTGYIKKDIFEGNYFVKHALENKFYCCDEYPKIIDKEIFDKVQKMKKGNKYAQKHVSDYPFFGKEIMFLEPLHLKLNGSFYDCKYISNCRKKISRQYTFSINYMDSILWHLAVINKKKTDLINIPNVITDFKNQISILEKKISSVPAQLDDLDKKIYKIELRVIESRLTEEKANKIEDEIIKQKDQIKNQEQEFRNKISDINQQIKKLSSNSNINYSDITDINMMSKIVHEEIKSVSLIRNAFSKWTMIIKFSTLYNVDVYNYETYHLYVNHKKLYNANNEEVKFNFIKFLKKEDVQQSYILHEKKY